MEFAEYFSLWNKLTPAQQNTISASVVRDTAPKGTILHNGSVDCTGLLLIRSGQLRAYILSDEGREITMYRLFDRDICLFSASCMIPSIQFEIFIEAEKETEYWLIPVFIYKAIMKNPLWWQTTPTN